MTPKHTRLLLLILTAFLTTHSLSYAQSGEQGNNRQVSEQSNTGIIFTAVSWSDALEKSKAAHKYIFVDAYASWCGPCKMLKATTFKNNEVAAFFNDNFINLSIDMEKGEGVNLSAKWAIQAYPTLIIFDADGNPVLGTVGLLKPKDLMKFAKQALAKKQQAVSN